MTEQFAVQDVVEILNVLSCKIDTDMVALLLDVSKEQATNLLNGAQADGSLITVSKELVVADVLKLRDTQNFLLSLPIFCFRYLKSQRSENIIPCFERIVENLKKLNDEQKHSSLSPLF